MKSLLIILSLALIIQFSSCDLFKKSDPKPLTELQKLPPATQTGKNTFGCLINGKAFVPISTTDITAIYQQGILQIGVHTTSPYQSVGLSVDETNYGPITTISYPLNKPPNSSGGSSYMPLNGSSLCSTQAISGVITITKIDRVSYIVSGTFEFSSAASGCDTLKITNGRFDIKYIP
ncbi:MAG: hypothetical protein JST43_09005 [Bacteroidetes bacterium]|nr:hypothetical protein [Bacteroidota bacterium]MBS1539482.1 hypothetical protein [Bacteroidota bacterium]